MEDKIGLKKNSLFENQDETKQDSILNFCKKIKIAKKSSVTNDFLVIARIESLILGKNVKDALNRAEKYSRAGADCIMIHSKNKNPDEIFKFSKIFVNLNFLNLLLLYLQHIQKLMKRNCIKIILRLLFMQIIC